LGVARLRPNFFLQRPNFLAELAQESWRDLAAVQHLTSQCHTSQRQSGVLFNPHCWTSQQAETCRSQGGLLLPAGGVSGSGLLIKATTASGQPWRCTSHHHTGVTIASKFRKLYSKKLVVVKAKFKQLEEDGIIQRSTSPWSSPHHMVRKSEGSWHPCSDFRHLNLVTEPDVYLLLDFAVRGRVAQHMEASTYTD
jgi:hypothetical protein